VAVSLPTFLRNGLLSRSVYRSHDCRIKGSVTLLSDQSMTRFGFFNPMQTSSAIQTHDGCGISGFSAAKVARLVAACALLGVAACTSAGDENHPLRGAASTVGWATTAGTPKDFVVARRTTTDLNFVPVGRGGVERPVIVRNAAAVQGLEGELDRQRDQSEGYARRQLPAGAYGRPLPSVSAPPRAQRAGLPERPTPGQPESYPVNPNRLRQIRDNSRQAND
jgi:hypothetical protein